MLRLFIVKVSVLVYFPLANLGIIFTRNDTQGKNSDYRLLNDYFNNLFNIKYIYLKFCN